MPQFDIIVYFAPQDPRASIFTQGSDRVDNCGKRVLLEDLKNRFEADPGGKVFFVGHIAQSSDGWDAPAVGSRRRGCRDTWVSSLGCPR